MLDAVNSLRQAAGAPPVQLNAKLNAAAATHARDMSVQNRPWHFGSDGSSPIDRVARVGYPGQLVGENISETFETELETLSAWMDTPNTPPGHPCARRPRHGLFVASGKERQDLVDPGDGQIARHGRKVIRVPSLTIA